MAQRYQGKRVADRKAARPRRRFRPELALLAGGITLAIVAWGYLVWTAIAFGGDARGGDGRAWGFLAVAALGACACLFIGLMLIARLGRALGLTSAPPPQAADRPATPAFPPMEGEELAEQPMSRHRAS